MFPITYVLLGLDHYLQLSTLLVMFYLVRRIICCRLICILRRRQMKSIRYWQITGGDSVKVFCHSLLTYCICIAFGYLSQLFFLWRNEVSLFIFSLMQDDILVSLHIYHSIKVVVSELSLSPTKEIYYNKLISNYIMWM